MSESEDFDEIDEAPDAEEPVTAEIYNPDAVSHVGLGAVDSVTLINFMCHDHFSIKFGPRVNFVVGQNGSGKSAILTALVVCFGGRAGLTNRGKAVKSFIKKGQTTARVIIELCNHSNGDTDFSFKYEIYGRKIIIERTINANGQSQYVIKNEKGHNIDTTKKELDAIIRHFSIQIDNPVVILNQEVSRNFLNSRNQKEKYEFFMRATNLADHKENLIKLKKRLEWAKSTKADKEKIMPDLEAEVRSLKQKLERLQSVKKYRDQKQKKEDELHWSYVRDKELALQVVDNNLSDQKEKLERLQQNADQYEEKLAELKLDKQTNDQKCREQNERVNIATREAVAARKELDRLGGERQKLAFECKKNELEVRNTDVLIKKWEDGIQEEIEKQGDPQTIRRERQQRQEKILELEEEVKRLADEFNDKKKVVNELNDWLEVNRKRLDDMSGERNHTKRQIDAMKRQLEQLESSRTDNRAIFGPHVPKVNELIDQAVRENKFRVRPIGPIGQYITLTDRSVSIAVQSVMRLLVRAYAVDNVNDQSVLREIFKKVIPDQRQFPQIVTRKFTGRRFDVDQNIVQHQNVKSLLEYITVTDANAFNVLIDKTGMESIAYIADNAEARHMLLNIRTVPFNCRKAYSRDGTEFNPTTQRRGFSEYPNEFNNRADVFSLDIAGQSERLRHDLLDKQEQVAQLNSSGTSLRSQIDNRDAQVKKLEAECGAIRSKRLKSNQELTTLKDYVEPVTNSVANLQWELEEKKKHKEEVEQIVTDLKKQLADKVAEVAAAEIVLSEKEELKADAEHKLSLCQTRRQKVADDIANMESSRSQNELNRQSQKVAELQERRDAAAKEVEDMTEKALGRCPRIDTRRKPEELKQNIRELDKMITECEKITGSEKEAEERYQKAKNNVEANKTVIGAVTDCFARCNQMLMKRRDLFYKTRAEIVEKMKVQFAACLDSLEFAGSLEVEHGGKETVNGETVYKEAKLQLRVNPKGGQTTAAYSDTRSLSGGERSYSTVAFLLALWEGCCSPFRILDEVDVYMDMITRQVAMDALVAAACENKRQYIFLSPLPLIQDHAKHEAIRIHHMPQPVRVDNHSASG